MKTLTTFLLLAVLLSSCTAVKFANPQPKGSAALDEFPQKILGTFTSDESDTLRIMKTSFRFSDGKEVGFEADLSAENTILKLHKRTYILNLKDNGSWDVFPMKLSANKITLYFADLTSKTEALLKAKHPETVREIKTEDGKFDHYLIDPSAKEFERLLKKKLFADKVEFKRLR
ncbi:hypothetical protein [Salinimicrobium sp. HB62]|uniref:hypothetical protein n=1 Tax=Salinimicrobium sp. HB62 TaxID=3077781 RepID=UPI002D788C9A|nr:hypothetical protein [Salinimicrobium sp. HB62]